MRHSCPCACRYEEDNEDGGGPQQQRAPQAAAAEDVDAFARGRDSRLAEPTLVVTSKDSESLRHPLLVLVFPHAKHTKACGKTSTNIRVNRRVSLSFVVTTRPHNDTEAPGMNPVPGLPDPALACAGTSIIPSVAREVAGTLFKSSAPFEPEPEHKA